MHPSSASIRVRLNGDALDRIPNRKAVAGQGRPVLANSRSACVAWIRRNEVRCSDDRGACPSHHIYSRTLLTALYSKRYPHHIAHLGYNLLLFGWPV